MIPASRGAISGQASAEVTGIIVRTSLLAFLTAFPAKPCVSIDGGDFDTMFRREEFFPVEPGWHEVRCCNRAYNLPVLRIGDSSVKVLVPRGCVVALLWSGAASLFGGQLRIVRAG